LKIGGFENLKMGLWDFQFGIRDLIFGIFGFGIWIFIIWDLKLKQRIVLYKQFHLHLQRYE
jgi:hypothetical protein